MTDEAARERENLDAWLKRVKVKQELWEARIEVLEKAAKKPAKKSK
jgi:hypothetical protein